MRDFICWILGCLMYAVLTGVFFYLSYYKFVYGSSGFDYILSGVLLLSAFYSLYCLMSNLVGD